MIRSGENELLIRERLLRFFEKEKAKKLERRKLKGFTIYINFIN